MKRMGKISVMALIGLCVLFMVSCIPQFKNGLPVPENPVVDRKLPGNWEIVSKDKNGDEVYLHIYPRKSGKIDVLFVTRETKDKEDPIQVAHFEGFSTTLDNHNVLCMQETRELRGGKIDDPMDYMIFPYEVTEEGEFRVWILKIDAVAELVNKGKLPGEVDKGSYVTEVKVESPAERNRAVLERAGLKNLIEKDPTWVFVKKGK